MQDAPDCHAELKSQIRITARGTLHMHHVVAPRWHHGGARYQLTVVLVMRACRVYIVCWEIEHLIPSMEVDEGSELTISVRVLSAGNMALRYYSLVVVHQYNLLKTYITSVANTGMV